MTGRWLVVWAMWSVASAAEPREVHVDVGSSSAPLIVTAQVEDYRAAPMDLLKPVASADSPMAHLMKAYFQIFRAGDTNKVASLYEPHMRAGASDHFSTPQSMTEGFEDLQRVGLLAVLHWGEYQFAFVESERAAAKKDGLPRWSAAHAAHCVGTTCRITDNFEVSQLGRFVAEAFGKNGATHFAVPAQGETALPILPVVDANQQPVAIDPMILHLSRASGETTAAASEVVIPTLAPPWALDGVYSFGPDFCAAVLKSNQNRAVNLVPLERTGTRWAISPEPSTFRPWWFVSSTGAIQALRDR